VTVAWRMSQSQHPRDKHMELLRSYVTQIKGSPMMLYAHAFERSGVLASQAEDSERRAQEARQQKQQQEAYERAKKDRQQEKERERQAKNDEQTKKARQAGQKSYRTQVRGRIKSLGSDGRGSSEDGSETSEGSADRYDEGSSRKAASALPVRLTRHGTGTSRRKSGGHGMGGEV
jgi:hypothetical protein